MAKMWETIWDLFQPTYVDYYNDGEREAFRTRPAKSFREKKEPKQVENNSGIRALIPRF